MRNQKLITFMGQTLNIAQWARKYGVHPDTLARRVRSGWEFKDALFAPSHKPEKIAIGNSSHTVAEIAKAANTTAQAIYTRRRRGWKKEELPALKARKLTLTAFGKTQTFNEWAKETGLPRYAIHNRLRQGWSLEEALSTPRFNGGQTRYYGRTAFGRTQTLREWAKEFGMTANTLRSRVRKGLPLEVALRLPVDKALSHRRR
jgi:hypothetical protein